MGVRVEPLRTGIRTGKPGEAAASARRGGSWSCGNASQTGTFQLELEQKHKGGKVGGSCQERGKYFNTILINVYSVLGCGD